MNNGMTRSLIKQLVRGKLKDLKESPERTTRNLVDMALHFSNGRFQKHFFEIAQEMLHNENSPYYQLIYHIVSHVDTERILSFGMNVGYNSFTYGAKIIRKQETENSYNIPWCITLELDEQTILQHPEHYHKLLNEGKSLGIYTWNIFSHEQLIHFLPLMEMNSDCAFFLFCRADELTDNLLDNLMDIHNFMFVVEYDEAKTDIFAVLQNRNFLFSSYLSYRTEDCDSICSNELLYCLSTTNSVFVFFLPEESCDNKILLKVCKYTQDTLKNPIYKTLPFEFIGDNRRIDSIISDDACCAWFLPDGSLASHPALNHHEQNLSDILRTAFPRRTITTSLS